MFNWVLVIGLVRQLRALLARRSNAIIAGIGLVVAVLVVVTLIPTRSETLIQEAHEAVKLRLTDPESARFRNDSVANPDDIHTLVCGEVNSRNHFGGFVGFRRYIYVVHSKRTAVSGDDSIADEITFAAYSDEC